MLNLDNLRFALSAATFASIVGGAIYLGSVYTGIQKDIAIHGRDIAELQTYKTQTAIAISDIRNTLSRLDERTLSILEELKKK